jgi:hypothetical protein
MKYIDHPYSIMLRFVTLGLNKKNIGTRKSGPEYMCEKVMILFFFVPRIQDKFLFSIESMYIRTKTQTQVAEYTKFLRISLCFLQLLSVSLDFHVFFVICR